MTASVALCTYNGAQFIEEQLRSILHQTISVSEVVICDDRSKDNTIEIVEKIAAETTIPIRIYINETNLGCVRNFDKAIKLCHGDIIFLADQDDIWVPNKVDKVVAYFKTHPKRSVIISNATLIDENGNTLSENKTFDAIGLSSQLKYIDLGFAPELLLQHNRATGCTMALRKTFVQMMNINLEAKPNTNSQIHDGCIAMSAALKNALGYIKDPLTLYRNYSSQACGLGEYVRNPMRHDCPLIPINYLDTSYNIIHPRLQIQVLRSHYTRKKGVLLHIGKYYEAYGLKLMWIVIAYDIYLRMKWLMTRCINAAKKYGGKFLLKPFSCVRRVLGKKK